MNDKLKIILSRIEEIKELKVNSFINYNCDEELDFIENSIFLLINGKSCQDSMFDEITNNSINLLKKMESIRDDLNEEKESIKSLLHESISYLVEINAILDRVVFEKEEINHFLFLLKNRIESFDFNSIKIIKIDPNQNFDEVVLKISLMIENKESELNRKNFDKIIHLLMVFAKNMKKIDEKNQKSLEEIFPKVEEIRAIISDFIDTRSEHLHSF